VARADLYGSGAGHRYRPHRARWSGPGSRQCDRTAHSLRPFSRRAPRLRAWPTQAATARRECQWPQSPAGRL